MDVARLQAIFTADITQLTAGCKRASQAVANTAKGMERSVAEAAGAFSRLGDSANKAGLVIQALGLGMITQQAQAFGMECVSLYGELESLTKALTATNDGATSVKDTMAELKEIAKLPGLGFTDAARSAVMLQGAGVAAKDYLRILREFGNAVAASGGGAQDLQMAMVGVVQMLNKGKVSAQDLYQITDRISMIRQKMKDAFGTADTEKIQEMGISSKEFIDRITDELATLDRVQGGVANDMENLEQSYTELKQDVGKVLAPAFKGLADAISTVSERFQAMPEGRQKLLVYGTAAGIAAAGITLLITSIRSVIYQFRFYEAEVRGAADAQKDAAIATGTDTTAIGIQNDAMRSLDLTVQNLTRHLERLMDMQLANARAAAAQAEAQAAAAGAGAAGGARGAARTAGRAAGRNAGTAVDIATDLITTGMLARAMRRGPGVPGGQMGTLDEFRRLWRAFNRLLPRALPGHGGGIAGGIPALPGARTAANNVNLLQRALQRLSPYIARASRALQGLAGIISRSPLGKAGGVAGKVGSFVAKHPAALAGAAAVAGIAYGGAAIYNRQSVQNTQKLATPTGAEMRAYERAGATAARNRTIDDNEKEVKRLQGIIDDSKKTEKDNRNKIEANEAAYERHHAEGLLKGLNSVLDTQKKIAEQQKKQKAEADEYQRLQYDIKKAEIERWALQGGNEDLAEDWMRACDAAKAYAEELKEIAIEEKNGAGVEARKQLAAMQYQNTMAKIARDRQKQVEEKEKERRQEALAKEAEALTEQLTALQNWAQECKRVHEEYKNDVISNAKDMYGRLNDIASKGQVAMLTTAATSVTEPEFLTPEMLQAAKKKTDRDRYVTEYNKQLADRYVDNGAERKFQVISDQIDRAMKVIRDRSDEKYAEQNNAYLRGILGQLQQQGKQLAGQKSVIRA